MFGLDPRPLTQQTAGLERHRRGHRTWPFSGAVEKEDRDRLLGALDLRHRTVDEIMRHRRQIEMIDADLPPGEIITRVLASPHTRLPIFRDSDDNILGVVHAKDLLREVDRLVRGEDGSSGIEGAGYREGRDEALLHPRHHQP